MTKTVTAADVRAYFNADPKRLAALMDTEPKAVKTVQYDEDGKAPRGRLHPAAVAMHNKRRKVQYVSGATKEAQATAKAARLAQRVAAFDKGMAVGARGPLSKETQKALGLTK